jgi:hypothetical protein
MQRSVHYLLADAGTGRWRMPCLECHHEHTRQLGVLAQLARRLDLG